MTITLTKEKREKMSMLVKQIVNCKRVKVRDISKVLGAFEAALPSVKYRRPHLFFLQKLKNSTLRKCLGNYDGFCKLDEEIIKELTWWANNLNSSNKIDMLTSKFIIFSDACPNGWGAAYENHSTGGHWSKEQSLLHINMLEMKAGLFAIKIFAKEISNCTVHLNVDNTSTLSWINKQIAPNETFSKL